MPPLSRLKRHAHAQTSSKAMAIRKHANAPFKKQHIKSNQRHNLTNIKSVQHHSLPLCTLLGIARRETTMMFSRTVLVLALAVNAASAFSPSARSTASQVSQIVEERQRFQPRTSPMFVGEDEMSDDVESPPEEDYIVNVGDIEDDDEDGSLVDGEPPVWYTSHIRREALRAEHRRHDKDTGSPEYQVAGMTERISYLTKHLQQHPKDFSTRRGLVAMVNKRRRLLNFLYKKDQDAYVAIVKSLGIRHKAPGRYDKQEQYAQFPKQKAVKKHLVKRRRR